MGDLVVVEKVAFRGVLRVVRCSSWSKSEHEDDDALRIVYAVVVVVPESSFFFLITCLPRVRRKSECPDSITFTMQLYFLHHASAVKRVHVWNS